MTRSGETLAMTAGALLLCMGLSRPAGAQDADALAYYRTARIDWRQQAGASMTVALNKHPYTESLVPRIPEFEALTGIKVDYLILPENEYYSKLTADLSQQSGTFSAFVTGSIRNWQYIPAGWVVPLDQFLSDPKLTDPAWYDLNDVYPALVASDRWAGEMMGGAGEGPLYSVPALEESYILAYRKDLFDKYGIAVPRTMDEMAAAAATIKAKENIPGIVARGTPSAPTVSTGFVSGLRSYANGQWAEFDRNKHADFADPRSVEFTAKWIDMIRDSGPTSWANTQWYDAEEAFMSGQAGMIADCDFFAATYEDPAKSKVAGKVAYAVVPGGSGGVPYAALTTGSMAVSAAAKNKAAAWLFVEWATSKRSLLDATVNYKNYNPARISVYDDPRVRATMGAWGGGTYLPAVEATLRTASTAWRPEPERSRVGDMWARALQDVYFKRATAEQALQQLDKDVDRVLKNAGIVD